MNTAYVVKVHVEPEHLGGVMQAAILALSDKNIFHQGILISYRLNEFSLVCEYVPRPLVDEVKAIFQDVCERHAPAPVNCISVHDQLGSPAPR